MGLSGLRTVSRRRFLHLAMLGTGLTGLAGRMVVTRHALKNALIPVVTIVGLQFGNLMAGAVIIETVFAR